jgi:hypothetical protein
MNTKTSSAFLTSVFAAFVVLALLLGLIGTSFSQAAPLSAPMRTTPVTTITVNSGTDPDTSNSTKCTGQTLCTLRRAVIEARSLSEAQKPVLIAFNIPALVGDGYNSTLNIWKLQFSGISSISNASLHYLNGKTIIDGSTQPGGRATGPKIILVGQGTGQRDGLKLGETATQNSNEIRGLGFQNFKTHIYINSASNLIENNWFGLSDNGTQIVLRNGVEDDGSGNTGVSVGTNVINNNIQHNVFAGLAGVAAAINGNYTTFSNNYVGTTANGSVPGKQTNPALICAPVDWLGGSGISLSGNHNTVESNIFAGLRIAVVPPTIQADTIRMTGDYHTILNNKIGVDATNAEIGVCGRGVYLESSTKFNQITTNTIVNAGLSAISLNDSPTVSTSWGNTLRGNVIKKSSGWGAIEGNPSPEDAIQMGPGLPTAFKNFKPAKVTAINGKTVSGTSGTGSACPNCIIEIFLEDKDTISESLSSLAVVTANASGNWTATLPAKLTTGQRLRTTTTTVLYGNIPGMYEGTTTGLSELYGTDKFYLPLCRK